MNAGKERTRNFRRFIKIWFLTVSQVFGVLGAAFFGYYLDGGIQGYLMGYLIGVIISFGGAIGLA
jgi:hypothetical protein